MAQNINAYLKKVSKKDDKYKSEKKGRKKPAAARQQAAKMKGTLSRIEKAGSARVNELKKKGMI
ncbi:MAG: hypothetical protein ACRCXZ_01595 [Patescibacteria group bacterium]